MVMDFEYESKRERGNDVKLIKKRWYRSHGNKIDAFRYNQSKAHG